MNQNSILCQYINNHPDWENELACNYGLKIKREGPFAIFNYGHDCDFSDPIVQEARGIILNLERLEVACWPFRKFGNFYESYADEIDWETARVQEKVDGSIIKLWYNDRNGAWEFSTNGMIFAEKAKTGEKSEDNYFDLIKSSENYPDIPFESLNKDHTYIFELVSPKIQVVVRYERTMLFHTGTRDRMSGQELNEDIGIVKPKSYSLHSLDACIQAAKKLNESVSDKGRVEKEGFVVVDSSWHRVKIKSPDYLVNHHLVERGEWTMKRVLELLWEEKKDVDYLCRLRPDDARIFLYYSWQLEELAFRCDRMAEYARAVNREAEGDRRAVARVIGKSPLAAVGFWALGNSEAGRVWMERKSLGVLMKYMKEYEPVSLFD